MTTEKQNALAFIENVRRSCRIVHSNGVPFSGEEHDSFRLAIQTLAKETETKETKQEN